MLTVYTMCTGTKYPPEYIHKLQRAVGRNLNQPHRFVCITEHEVEGVETIKPPTDWPGWWGKLGLFKEGFASGPCMWLDLDVVVVGSLDAIADEHKSDLLAAPWNWAESGHGGIQSSVMVWNANLANGIYADFELDHERIMRAYWGDQEYMTSLRDDGFRVTQIKHPAVVSFKYHCRHTGPPSGASVVCFHGKPDPHEVRDPWVTKCWA